MKCIIKYSLSDIKKKEKEDNKYIELYILGIRIKRINIDLEKLVYMVIKRKIEKKNEKPKWENKLSFSENVKVIERMLKMFKIAKFSLNLMYNLEDEILNAYTIAIINAFIPLLFNLFEEVEEKNLNYMINTNTNLFNLTFECILSFNIVKNIPRIINIFFIILKGGKKNGTKTSNRITHGNIYEFNRIND